MRFKQTKPQHVRIKEEECMWEEETCNETDSNLDGSVENADWHGYDCVDGDITPNKSEACSIPVKPEFSPEQQNGHLNAMEMDLGPMLALYTEEDASKSSVSPDLIEEKPVTDEGEVIIQGRRPIFSESEENFIATQLNQWKEKGMKYTRLDVVKMASEYAVQLGKRPHGRPLTVKWFRSFLTRHPECYIRKSRKAIKVPECPERPVLNHLDTMLSSGNMKNNPHCIFSLIELPLPQSFDSNGFGVNGAKNLRDITQDGKIPSSIIFCGSASGQAIPPYLIFTGKTMDKEWMAHVTPGAGGSSSATGRLTSEMLITYLKGHFINHAPGRTDEALLILVDVNIGQLLNQAITDLASAYKITFVSAVNSLSPQFHPLALGCCSTFEQEYCYELQKALYSTDLASVLTSASVCEFLCRLYHRNTSAENLHASFKKTGIFPFNPSICRKRYASSIVCSSVNKNRSGPTHSLKTKKESKSPKVGDMLNVMRHGNDTDYCVKV